MAYQVPPPNPRPRIKAAIEAMEPKTDLLFSNSSADSIKTIVARIRKEYRDRNYITAKAHKGARVWRLA